MSKYDKTSAHISCNAHGWYCYFEVGYDDGKFHYIRKDGYVGRAYDGKFFATAAEAGEFLDKFLEKNLISREEIAERFNIPKDFILVD